jgi:hypothetical protein
MAAGAKVAARFAGMLPGLGIGPDSIPTIEARFMWQLDVLQVSPAVTTATRPGGGGGGGGGACGRALYRDAARPGS